MNEEAKATFLELLAAGQPFEVKNLATGEITMVIPNASMMLSEAGLSVFASSAGQGAF